MKKDVDVQRNFHLDKDDIYKKNLIEDEVVDSDHRNKARLCTVQEPAVANGSLEILLKECHVKENFGEVSLKEEVSEEFFHTETSSFPNVDGQSTTKSENSQPNPSSDLLQQESPQEKKRKLRSSSNLVINPQVNVVRLPPCILDYDSNQSSGVCSRLEISPQCSENNFLPSHSTDANSHAPKHSRINKKIFKCCSCPYETDKNFLLTRHLKTHTGENPFKCSLCPFQTRTKHQLKSHLYTHTGEKPFKCDICSYQAARKQDIKIHSIWHTGEKPFKCIFCPFQAATKRTVQIHTFTHW